MKTLLLYGNCEFNQTLLWKLIDVDEIVTSNYLVLILAEAIEEVQFLGESACFKSDSSIDRTIVKW